MKGDSFDINGVGSRLMRYVAINTHSSQKIRENQDWKIKTCAAFRHMYIDTICHVIENNFT